MKRYVAYYNRKTGKFEKKINIKDTYYRCDFFSFVSPPVMNMCNLLLQSTRRYQCSKKGVIFENRESYQ